MHIGGFHCHQTFPGSFPSENVADGPGQQSGFLPTTLILSLVFLGCISLLHFGSWLQDYCVQNHRCFPRDSAAPGAAPEMESQKRTGESGAFGMWHHPRGSSRISS